MVVGRRWLVAIAALVVVSVAAGGAWLLTRPADPLTVVRSWAATRNAGDVDGALSHLGESGDIFGIGLHQPGGREELRTILEAQAIAGFRIDDRDCAVNGENVRCRYVMSDEPMRRWGLQLAGEHSYTVRDGRLVRSSRVHDPEARTAVYAAAALFEDWVREAHPELHDVIWTSFDSVTYSTPDGARAVTALLDEYDTVRGAG